jgi:hypothetical protein
MEAKDLREMGGRRADAKAPRAEGRNISFEAQKGYRPARKRDEAARKPARSRAHRNDSQGETAQGREKLMEARRMHKERQGVVLSNKMQKTVIVAVERTVLHLKYKKYLKRPHQGEGAR